MTENLLWDISSLRLRIWQANKIGTMRPNYMYIIWYKCYFETPVFEWVSKLWFNVPPITRSYGDWTSVFTTPSRVFKLHTRGPTDTVRSNFWCGTCQMLMQWDKQLWLPLLNFYCIIQLKNSFRMLGNYCDENCLSYCNVYTLWCHSAKTIGLISYKRLKQNADST